MTSSGFFDTAPDLEGGWNGALGIVMGDVGPDRATAGWETFDPELGPMPAATAAIEATCSIGAAIWWGERGRCVGMSNHTTSFTADAAGPFTATAVPVDQGATQQLWRCEVRAGDGSLCASGEVLVANLDG